MANLNHESVTLDPGTVDNNWSLDHGSSLYGNVNFPGDLTLWINGQSIVRLSGTVGGAVRIKNMDGQSVIDLLGLAPGQVIFECDINGQSYFHSSATGVSLNSVYGQSHVLVTGGGSVDIHGVFDNASRAYLVVDNLKFQRIDGASRLYVQSRNGSVTGDELSGSSVITILDQAPDWGAAVLIHTVHYNGKTDPVDVPELLTWPEHPNPPPTH